MRILGAGLIALLLPLVLGGCTGDFDQREEQATTVGIGHNSAGTSGNPSSGPFVRGVVDMAGVVRNAGVVLRPINDDGSVNWDDNDILGSTVTFSNGIYQARVLNKDYEGPILVEVRGQTLQNVHARGANPATADSNKYHTMGIQHVLYSVLPHFEGQSAGNVHVTPTTTVAVGRCLSFDGSIAGVTGGISAGMFSMCCQQVAKFFGLDQVRASHPQDFAASEAFGKARMHAFVITALCQVAHDAGVQNIFDFWDGLYEDALDDGELNASIGLVPNTGVAMPDLGVAGLLGDALLNGYLVLGNDERQIETDATDVPNDNSLDNLITFLDTARDINSTTATYDILLRDPGSVTIKRGKRWKSRIFAMDQIGNSAGFHAYGDSGGPCFVDFAFVSSSPANVVVNPFGEISVPLGASKGNYTLTLTVQPFAGQTFVAGPTYVRQITVKVE